MADVPAQRERTRFPARLRIRRKRDFERLLRESVSRSDGRLTIRVVANGLDETRFGLIVGRRHGNAVRRNRIKRVLRAAFRLCRGRLPAGLDIACSPCVGADIELHGAMESLVRLTRQLPRQRDGRQ